MGSVEHDGVSPIHQLINGVAGVGVRNACAQCPADRECDREKRFCQNLIAPIRTKMNSLGR